MAKRTSTEAGRSGEAVAEHEEPALGEVGEQPAAAGHERVDTLGLLQIGEGSAPDIVDLAQDEIGVVKPKAASRPTKAANETRAASAAAFKSGMTAISESFSDESWLEISKRRMESTSSPKKSTR